MMNIFTASRYVTVLRSLIEARKKSDADFSMARLAISCSLQPSYLTNVVKERAQFNADQLFAVARALGCSPAETEYLLLLLEHERSHVKERKEGLKQQLEAIRNRQLRAEKHLRAPEAKRSPEDLQRYYLNPYVELVHIYLGLEKSSHEPKEIARRFEISEPALNRILKSLEGMKLITRKGRRWSVGDIHQHLTKDSPLSQPSQLLKRIQILDRLQRLTVDEHYSFTATFSASAETRRKIQGEFLNFLKSCEGWVREDKAEQIYQMAFDILPW